MLSFLRPKPKPNSRGKENAKGYMSSGKETTSPIAKKQIEKKETAQQYGNARPQGLTIVEEIRNGKVDAAGLQIEQGWKK